MSKLIEFKNYSMGFRNEKGQINNLLDNICFSIEEGKAVGVVGESGCGKSMTSLSIMGLLPTSAVIQGGEILYKGTDLLKKSEIEMQKIRGREIAMIFQEPMTALNPVLTIGFQIGEVLKIHFPNLKEEDIKKEVIQQLELVGIPNPEARVNQYPHQFSGGMRQRVMIAMALICKPKLLIADEATTALDVTIQAQVLDLMKRLKENGSLMVVTHNLGVVAEICDKVVVMYAGRVVEQGSLEAILENPKHPYTRGLMAAIPTMVSSDKELYTIPGTVPNIEDFEKGCRFFPRCEYRLDICKDNIPPTKRLMNNHYVQCWLEFEGEEANDDFNNSQSRKSD
ncbi:MULTISPECIES: ABC transporter ATP-binding protein [Tepidanaerobacter]|uniref:ABC transporter ATP-binding protein n=1 Tax=Tepidanaerobacter TaxID=499228 RepID=UPI000A860AC6|nr:MULTISPECIES: ABC transporter ATP-binding protein [Tepidanaerobacter]GLI52002.1 dipeptide/oligopeptide/nickel ABC transporter ATP-binding protein [Tepidanaerobacter syntrophicus]HHV82549.1 ABC transporter ATP-binding protein [Tepidanaerobacter syntrophicus]